MVVMLIVTNVKSEMQTQMFSQVLLDVCVRDGVLSVQFDLINIF